MIKPRKLLYPVLAALLALTGCGAANPESSHSSAPLSSPSVPQSAASEAQESASEPEKTEAGADEYYEYVGGIIEKELFKLEHLKDINAYGEFTKYTYYSNTAERESRVNVLLPPDYSEDREYPVLYVLHGFFDNEDWMKRENVGVPQMLTELYEKGEAEEMIVVLPYIFVSKELPYCTGMDLTNCLAYDNFINDLTTDLMPFIESKFSVKKGRENTAITGFSMGGRESLFIGIKRPDLFGYVGACCPAPGLVPIPGSDMHPGQLQENELKFPQNGEPKVLFISAGGNDGVVGSSPQDYHEIFDKNGVKNFFQLMPGTSHDNTSVVPHMYKYLSMVFR